MTTMHTVSALDAILSDCLVRRVHFITVLPGGIALCRLCSRMWAGAEAYAEDIAPSCPGYVQCGQAAR